MEDTVYSFSNFFSFYTKWKTLYIHFQNFFSFYTKWKTLYIHFQTFSPFIPNGKTLYFHFQTFSPFISNGNFFFIYDSTVLILVIHHILSHSLTPMQFIFSLKSSASTHTHIVLRNSSIIKRLPIKTYFLHVRVNTHNSLCVNAFWFLFSLLISFIKNFIQSSFFYSCFFTFYF
jgi:hypothetical protein